MVRGGGGAMSHVDFLKWQCRMSLISHVTCRTEEIAMSHVTMVLTAMSHVT